MFEGGKGSGKGQFESPTGIAVDSYGKVFIADMGNHSIEKFSPTGAFVSTIKIVGNNHGHSSEPSGIAVDHVGYTYVADASKQCVEKLAFDGTLIAEWNGPEPWVLRSAPHRHRPRGLNLSR